MLTLLFVLIIAGVLLWFVNQYVPMEQPFKVAVNLVALLWVILFCLSLFHIVKLPSHDLIVLVVILAIVGVLMWFVNQYVPMTRPFKVAANVVAVLLLLLYILHLFRVIVIPLH